MKCKFLTALFLLSLTTYGQNDLPLKTYPSLHFIEVTGTALKEITPDKIFISITLTNKIIDKQQYNIQSQEEKLKKVLIKNNIDLGLLSLSDATSEILTHKNKDIGYEVKKSFILQLSTADQVSKIAKELQDLNIKETSIIKLEHSKIDSLRREVRIAAIKAAKEKAEYLLHAIGEQIDKPIEIREVVDNPYFRDNRTSNTTLFNVNVSTTKENNEAIDFDKIKISFSYFIKYAIK